MIPDSSRERVSGCTPSAVGVVSRLVLGLGLAAAECALGEGYSIRNPGPDLANFPNSAFTLPRGRAYVEVSPVNLSTPNSGSPATFSACYLLRYGLIDDLELRLF